MSRHSSSITFDDSVKDRIDRVKVGTETTSQFIYRATIEKLNRMETRDERARKQQLEKDIKMLKPIIASVLDKLLEQKEEAQAIAKKNI